MLILTESLSLNGELKPVALLPFLLLSLLFLEGELLLLLLLSFLKKEKGSVLLFTVSGDFDSVA